MSIRYEAIKPGDILYLVGSRQMGHTTMRTAYCEVVRIVRLEGRGSEQQYAGAVVSIGGRESWWSRRQLEKLRRSKPEFETNICGASSLVRKKR